MSGLVSTALLSLLLAAPSPELGTPVRQDGYTVRPPQDFKMARMALFHGTRAMAMSGTGAYLSAALVDGADEEASTMLVSMVDGSFRASPADREAFSEQVTEHFKERLALAFSAERAEHVAGPTPRVEVVGTVRQEEQLRRVVAVAFAGEGRHVVIVFSVSAGRWDALWPTLRASLDSFRPDAPPAGELPRGLALAAAALAASLLVASGWLYRRRRRAGPVADAAPG